MRTLPRYIAAQSLGAVVANAVLFAISHGVLVSSATAHGIPRGVAGAEATAMIFRDFPNPGGQPLTGEIRLTVSRCTSFFAEFAGAAILITRVIFRSCRFSKAFSCPRGKQVAGS